MPDPTPHPDVAPPEQLAGRLLAGRYRLNRPLASGGMAQVWEATDETLTRRVAVKLLHAHLAGDASFVQRFRDEAISAARLAHPAIVSIYDTFSVDGLEGIVMELVSGTTMRADLDDHGPMRLEAVLAIGTQVADALGAAHAARLVHRDVKPANILLAADGRVLVADFGIAKALESADLTSVGTMIGTAKYLAPEQVEGTAIDGRADLYALGVVLYEALTGVPPFVADSDTATALARLHRDPRPPRTLRPDIPRSVEAVVLQAMARRPEERFATAAAMRRALLAAGAEPARAPAAAERAAATAAHPPPIPPPPGRPPPPPPPGRTATDTAGAGRTAAGGVQPLPRTEETPPPRRRRAWPAVVVVAALATMAGYFVVAADGDRGGGEPVALASITTFDPQGDIGDENEDLVGYAIDGDPETVWPSESFLDPEALGKEGFGLVIELEDTASVSQVDVVTPEGGWRAAVHTATDAATVLEAWGPERASVADTAAGTTSLSLEPTEANAVLVWFTRVSPSGQVAVSELTVRAR